jgi:S-disulfanyl-L-cysteine oxidoreductase SoxD
MSHKIWKVILCLMILAFWVATASAYTTEQAAKGKELYVKHCAVCHGAGGEGGTVPQQFGKNAGKMAPRLVGPGGLPGMKTVGQVYDTAKKLMPLDKPGSLKSNEYLDIISFALQANDIKPDDKPLTPASAKKIKLGGGEK